MESSIHRGRSAPSLRISNIPLTMAEETLCKLLESLLVNKKDTEDEAAENIAKRHHEANIHTISLAQSPSPTDRYQIATVTFKKIPTELEDCLAHSTCFTIMIGAGDAKFEATIDSKFEGLTPLNNPSNPSVECVSIPYFSPTPAYLC